MDILLSLQVVVCYQFKIANKPVFVVYNLHCDKRGL